VPLSIFHKKEEFMKKFIVCFFVFFLAVGFVIAADETGSAGFTVGLEAGIENINKAYDLDMEPYLMPMLIYEQSFLDGAVDVYAELDYTFGFNRVPNEDGNDVFPQSLYFDFMLGYNIGFSSVSTLSIILENEFDELLISPRYKESTNLTGIFTPAVKYNHLLDLGDIYFMVGVPITYIQYEKKAKTLVDLDFTIGWYSNFGLGLEAKVLMQFLPADGAGYSGLEALVSYETQPMYFEVFAEVSKKVSEGGIAITPEFDYFFGNAIFYAKCKFDGIGIKEGKIVISPALGIKLSF
jgi:hypothetical protein